MKNINLPTDEKKGMIFNVQKYNVHDGPGIRTLVFFKGCPLECQWCSNPEGLEEKYQIMYKEDLCINCGACVEVCPVNIHKLVNGKHKVDRNIDCIGCRKCEEICTEFALGVSGKQKTVSQLLEIIEEDRMFYDTSGGGVTLGGGEVTFQSDFATELLKECKRVGINTAIETSGMTREDSILKMAEYVDLFLFDLKHMDTDRHYELTGVHNKQILSNLQELLKRGHDVHIRMPLLKGINDSQEEIKRTIDFLMPYRDYKNFKGIDLLPYHKMGVNKYKQLNKEYPVEGDPSLNDDDLNRIESWIKEYDFPVKVIKH